MNSSWRIFGETPSLTVFSFACLLPSPPLFPLRRSRRRLTVPKETVGRPPRLAPLRRPLPPQHNHRLPSAPLVTVIFFVFPLFFISSIFRPLLANYPPDPLRAAVPTPLSVFLRLPSPRPRGFPPPPSAPLPGYFRTAPPHPVQLMRTFYGDRFPSFGKHDDLRSRARLVPVIAVHYWKVVTGLNSSVINYYIT